MARSGWRRYLHCPECDAKVSVWGEFPPVGYCHDPDHEKPIPLKEVEAEVVE